VVAAAGSLLGRLERTTCIVWPIATDDSVAWSRDVSVMHLRCAKTAERIEARFGLENLGDTIRQGVKVLKFGQLSSLETILLFDAAFAELLWFFVFTAVTKWNMNYIKSYRQMRISDNMSISDAQS